MACQYQPGSSLTTVASLYVDTYFQKKLDAPSCQCSKLRSHCYSRTLRSNCPDPFLKKPQKKLRQPLNACAPPARQSAENLLNQGCNMLALHQAHDTASTHGVGLQSRRALQRHCPPDTCIPPKGHTSCAPLMSLDVNNLLRIV
jgi:hypothetical protein